MEILVLASGSSGNAIVVRSAGTTVLVDAGISALQVRRRLAALDGDVDDLDAVLVTHEHSDHARGLDVLLKRREVPVWATAGTWSRLPVRSPSGGELRSGRELAIGSLRVTPVATSHDAVEPVALVVDDGDRRVVVCTDTGIVTPLLAQRLTDADLLLLEANHDPDMLRHGPYPWPLKQRISSRLGHLGNHQTAEALDRVATTRLRGVVGLHLSEHNNRPELACDALRAAVAASVPVTAVVRGEMLRIAIVQGEVAVERFEAPPGRAKVAERSAGGRPRT